MKIRTRIILISCGAVLAASLLGDVIIWMLAKNSFQNEALIRAYQNTYMIVEDLEQKIQSDETLAEDDIFLAYYFKSMGDDYNICLRTDSEAKEGQAQYKEIYNHTVMNMEQFMHRSYESEIVNAGMSYTDIPYDALKWEGKQYVIFHKQIKPFLEFYRVEDISYVTEKMEWLTGCMLAITLVVTAAASILLSLILKRVLKPLKELNDTTKHMAEGFYNQRLPIKGRDEIGQLSENFNKMAEAVEARTHSLEESEKKKTLFMGNLTHELKTPMTAISGYAQTLLSTKLSEEEQQEALQYIYEECNRLERLSKKMMKLLELDQEQELELVDTPVRQIFDGAMRACEQMIKEKGLFLECLEHGESFSMDADLMTDVLINLIDNSVKASQPGGKIILRAGGDCIEVEDFGRGIPAEEIEKILEPFYMVDKSRSRKSGGAGLGLALTALIARRHNIQLKIESEEGKGSKIILQFV